MRNSPEARKKISEALKGRVFTEEHKRKIGKSVKRSSSTGNGNQAWKGDSAGYSAMHKWIVKELGRPRKCEECSTETAKRFEWSNVDHKYRRATEDYKRLCASCHRKYDCNVLGQSVFGKKISTFTSPNG
jgi:hypothetical protein